MKYQVIETSKLKGFPLRDVRPHVVEKIKGLIEKDGFNPAKPLTVMAENGHYIVPDGNHRLKVLQEMGIKEVPCLVREGDPVQIGITCNRAEDTYAPMDLFDWLEVIKGLKEQGKTNREISEVMGDDWEEGKVKQYSSLLKNISYGFLNLAKSLQKGRVTKKVTPVTFEFTEWWFRGSGLYNLSEKSQLEFFEWFKANKFPTAKNKQQKKVELLKSIEDQLEILKTLSTEIEEYEKHHSKLKSAIENGEYTNTSLEQVIAKLNLGAKNKAYFGHDALEVLKTLEDNSIDCVVTDPPWGVSFKSSRQTENHEYDSDIEEIKDYLNQVFTEIKRVTKDNSHIYVFYPSVHQCVFKEMLSNHFNVSQIPLIWVKGNHTPCDFKSRYASKYEPIFFCKNENGRELNNPVSPDVLLGFGHDPARWHDSQKPVDLLKYLIKNSTGTGETVLDPFAGSGSTLLAAKKAGRYYIGIEKEDSKDLVGAFKRAENELGR